MLGIKISTVNQAKLSLIPTHSLATQVVNRGSWKQKRELAQFLNEIALFRVSAAGVDYSISFISRNSIVFRGGGPPLPRRVLCIEYRASAYSVSEKWEWGKRLQRREYDRITRVFVRLSLLQVIPEMRSSLQILPPRSRVRGGREDRAIDTRVRGLLAAGGGFYHPYAAPLRPLRENYGF